MNSEKFLALFPTPKIVLLDPNSIKQKIRKSKKQARAELGQAQPNLGMNLVELFYVEF